MAEKTKRCAACGGEMSLRLGVYECAQCGKIEEPQVTPPPSFSGPGFQRQQTWQSGSGSGSAGTGQGGVAPPPPPPGQIPRYLAPPEGVYSGPEPRGAADSLDTEKKIYFGLQVLGAIFIVIIGVVGTPFTGGGFLMATLFIAVLAVGLSAFVLFSEEIWAKYTCIGCTSFSIFLVMGTLVGLIPAQALNANLPMAGFTQVFQILLNFWLITILYRDSMRLQGR